MKRREKKLYKIRFLLKTKTWLSKNFEQNHNPILSEIRLINKALPMNNINLGKFDEKSDDVSETARNVYKHQQFPLSEMISNRKARYCLFGLNKPSNWENSVTPYLKPTKGNNNSQEKLKSIVSLIRKRKQDDKLGYPQFITLQNDSKADPNSMSAIADKKRKKRAVFKHTLYNISNSNGINTLFKILKNNQLFFKIILRHELKL